MKHLHWRGKRWLVWLAGVSPVAYLALDRVLHLFGFCIGG